MKGDKPGLKGMKCWCEIEGSASGMQPDNQIRKSHLLNQPLDKVIQKGHVLHQLQDRLIYQNYVEMYQVGFTWAQQIGTVNKKTKEHWKLPVMANPGWLIYIVTTLHPKPNVIVPS